MDRNFYTRPEAGVVSGSANFATLISATPTAYGLVAAQATAYAALNTALQTAYATATEPTTRTPVSIQAKDLALKNVKASAKNLSQMVRATTTVTDAQLVALGLTPRTKPAPRPLTTVAPSVALVSCEGRLARFRLRDPSEPTRRGKPREALGANIFTFVGPTPPTDPRDFYYEGLTTRTLFDISFPNDVPSGSTVWVSACWISRRGEIGTASTPISFTLQGGAVSARATEAAPTPTRLAA